MRIIFSALALIASATLAAAQSSPAQFHTMEDARGWEAVGRLDIGGKGFCTGALIAPDLVLTAAHCLYETESRTRIDASAVTFRAGLRDGRALAERGVHRVAIHPEYVYSGGAGADSSAYDLALLELSQPIRASQVTPFETMSFRETDESVGIVSYAHDRAEAPALQEVCGILGQTAGVYVLSCAVDFGSSGAPVFQIDGVGHARIVSVVSAKAMLGAEPVAIASRLDDVLGYLLAVIEDGGDSFQAQAPGGVRVLTPGQRNDTGARFVRP